MKFILDLSTKEIKTNHKNFIERISYSRILKVWDMKLKNMMKRTTDF